MIRVRDMRTGEREPCRDGKDVAMALTRALSKRDPEFVSIKGAIVREARQAKQA